VSANENRLLFSPQGLLRQLRGDATQLAKRALLRLRLVPPPLRIVLDVTDRCNFRCPTCSKWRRESAREELSLAEWELVLDKIGSVPIMREAAISGGEPFMRRDMFDLLELVKGRGLRIVMVSNGWFLDERGLARLEEIGVERLILSLNSLRSEVHDASRGTPGSHERIMQFIDAWHAEPCRLELCIGPLIMEPNVAELTDIVRWATGKGLSGVSFRVLAPDEVHYAFGAEAAMPQTPVRWYADDPRWVWSVDVLRRQVDELLAMQREGGRIVNPPSQLRRVAEYYESPESVRHTPCLGTLSRMYVDPYGDVRLCYGFAPIGNVLTADPRALWRSPAARRVREASRSCTRLCRMLNNNL
jgi:sulfatase maturation enzyme AslB (radical SAM superfamily)